MSVQVGALIFRPTFYIWSCNLNFIHKYNKLDHVAINLIKNKKLVITFYLIILLCNISVRFDALIFRPTFDLWSWDHKFVHK